jgi:hypothetical protein
MPLALAAVSIMGQPSMLSRYAITAALAWGPWVAFAMELLGRWPARVSRIVFAWFLFVSFTKEANDKRAFASGVDQTLGVLRQTQGAGMPVVFQSIHVMYPVLGESWGRDSSAVFLDLPDSTFAALFPAGTRLEQLNRGTITERDLARVHAKRFGFPKLASQGVLDTTRRFLLLAPQRRLPPGLRGVEQFGRAVFPNHRLTHLHPELSLLERRPDAR